MSYHDAFLICRGVESQGHDLIQPLLKQLLRQWVPTHGAPPEYQRQNGDYVGTTARTDQFVTIELKTERKATGNLFIETWSNVSIDGGRLGWLHTLRAEWIWYSFLDERIVYVMKHAVLWDWCAKQGNIYRYRYIDVVSDQKNRTAGFLIPVEDLKRARVISMVWKEGEFDFEKVWQLDSETARYA